MKFLKNNLGTIIAIIVIIVLLFVYQNFFKYDAGFSDANSLVDQNVGREVVTLYNTLQVVNLDQDLFDLPSYLNLIDFSTVLSPQATGRTNPFDVIGTQ